MEEILCCVPGGGCEAAVLFSANITLKRRIVKENTFLFFDAFFECVIEVLIRGKELTCVFRILMQKKGGLARLFRRSARIEPV